MSENYLIIGNDKYIREREESKIKSKFLASDEIDLNCSICGPEDMDNVMDSLGTLPFLSNKRVVVLREAHGLSDASVETLLAYLEKPSETSILVLSSDTSFKKNKHYHRLSALVKEVGAEEPDEATIKSWISAFFKKENVEIAPAAVGLIVELKGTDTSDVKTELDKLLSFSGGEKIEVEHVEQLVGRSVTEAIFKLADAINARNAKWAFRVLNDLYDQKKKPHEIIGYLGWYIRIMQKITLLSGKGMGPEGVAAELGYSPGYTRRLASQAGKYPVNRIEHWNAVLLETDMDIKSGRKDARLALEMLLSGLLL